MARASFIFSLVCSAGVLLGQPSTLTGPVEGFTFDPPTRSFRAVIGSLGAAALGPAIVKGFDYGSVAPRRNYGLSFQGSRCYLVTGLGSSQASAAELAGDFQNTEGIVWSGNGSVAVAYSRTDNRIQIIRGLPGGAVAGPSISVAPAGSYLSSVASDFTGDHTAIGLVGETPGVFQVLGDRTLVPLVSASKPISLSFSDDGATLFTLDTATGNLFELNMADLTSQAWTLTGLDSPILVKAARDATNRRVVYAAGKTDRLLVAYDALSREIVANVPLNSEPSVIEALGLNSFLLGSRSADGEPLWSFTNAAQPMVYFVPVTPLVSEESGK